MSANVSDVKLQSPGAGLPLPELYIAKFRFWLYRRQNTAIQFQKKFEQEHDVIMELMKRFSPTSGTTPVLIPRLRGMEDSSRNWSAFMTLDHLSIVNGAIAKSIKTLSRGNVPEGSVGTADVKPNENSDASSVETFRRTSDIFLRVIAGVDNLKTKTKYKHPWFGPLDAFSWLALATFHMRLHRRQIESIEAKLNV